MTLAGTGAATARFSGHGEVEARGDQPAVAMRGRGLLVIAILASSSAVRAEATCAVELRGDATITEPIRAELRSFDDDGAPCVAVQVTCRSDGDRLEIELRDELGRSSLRVFTSPIGAAAFVISWSKRPVLSEPGIRPPSAAVVASPAAVVAPPLGATSDFGAPPERGLHPELAVSYIESGGPDSPWGVVTASLIWNHRLPDYGGSVRYGGSLRAVTAFDRYLAAEAEATIGLVTMLPRAFRIRVDLIAGAPIGKVTGGYLDDRDYGLMGRRVGAALAISKRLTGSLDVELGAGYDVSWLSLNSRCGYVDKCEQFDGIPHAAAGLRWTL